MSEPVPMSEIEIIQSDRDAAWPYRPSCYDAAGATRGKWMAGVYDSAAPVIKAFARHRLAHASQAARGDREAVADRLMQEFYLSKDYNPKAERPADTVKAAIAFVLREVTPVDQPDAVAVERVARGDREDEHCPTCGQTNSAFVCSDGFHSILALSAQPDAVAMERERIELASLDDARLALWQAIGNIRIGNKTDDKLILEELRKLGFWIAAIRNPSGEQKREEHLFLSGEKP